MIDAPTARTPAPHSVRTRRRSIPGRPRGARLAALPLLSALTVAGSAAPARAQTPARPAAPEADTAAVPVITLSEIVVVAERNRAKRAGTAYELDRARLAELDVRSARDALEHMPGIHFRRTARNEQTFRLRGFDQRQVAVFLDGVPVSLPYDGTVDVSLLAGPGLDRVQVSHGLASTLYGANALGGSVNLVTRLPSARPAGSARLEASDHGRLFTAAAFSGGGERLRFSGTASLERAASFRLPDGYAATRNEDGAERENSGYERRWLGLKAHWIPAAEHRIGMHVGVADNAFEVPPHAASERARYWRFPVWKRTVLSVNTRHALGSAATVRTAWYHDRYRNLLRSFDDATYTTQTRRYAFDSEYDDASWGVNVYPSLSALPLGPTDAVVAYRRDVHRQRDGTAPFERFAAEVLTLGVEQDVRWTPALGVVAGAGVHQVRLLEAGDDVRRDPLLRATGRLAAEYRLSPTLAAHAAVAARSRFPTLKELYSGRMGRNLPNPELRPEAARHAELGVRLEAGAWQGSAALHRSALRDAIAEAAAGDGRKQMRNIGRATLEGFELEVRHRGERHAATVGYAFLRARNTSADRTAPYLEYRPAHRASAVVDVRPHPRLRAGAELAYTAGQHYQDPDTRAWGRLDPSLALDLRAEVRITRALAFYARVENLLDALHYGEYGVPLPGRELSAGIRAELP